MPHQLGKQPGGPGRRGDFQEEASGWDLVGETGKGPWGSGNRCENPGGCRLAPRSGGSGNCHLEGNCRGEWAARESLLSTQCPSQGSPIHTASLSVSPVHTASLSMCLILTASLSVSPVHIMSLSVSPVHTASLSVPLSTLHPSRCVLSSLWPSRCVLPTLQPAWCPLSAWLWDRRSGMGSSDACSPRAGALLCWRLDPGSPGPRDGAARGRGRGVASSSDLRSCPGPERPPFWSRV